MPRTEYFRPIVHTDRRLAAGSKQLAGGLVRFDRVEVLSRSAPSRVIDAADLPDDAMTALTTPRKAICGLDLDAPKLMGILNVTPDSFSDGGLHGVGRDAIGHARKMIAEGADILDIGGESTRPGAAYVEINDEISRTAPAIKVIKAEFPDAVISIDTRKAAVARAAMDAGAGLFNDVSALGFDPDSLPFVVEQDVPVCLMHATGDPATMQNDPHYDNVLLDVYDMLENRVQACIAAGLRRERIMIDPGIGFGKTQDHNLTLMRGLSLFHGLGCPILLGVSRKRFIGTIGVAHDPLTRAPGSIAVALDGLRQGVQMLRVHDIAETKQAVRLWQAML